MGCGGGNETTAAHPCAATALTLLRSAQPAAREQLLAREPIRIVRGEEHRDRSDVLRLAGPAERRLRDSGFLEIGTDEPGAVRALGFDDAGVERVDADLARTEFAREHAGDRVDRAFRAGVDGAARGRDARHDRADVDHARALAE